jgi:hypothetical protein
VACEGATTSTVDTAVADTVSVTLADDEDVVCTFTNTADVAPTGGSLTINKVWVGGTAVDTTFTTSDSLGDDDDTIVLTAGVPSAAFLDLANAGVYTVAETVPAGWTAAVTCEGATTSTIDTAVANTVSVTLADDEDVTCTFTNTADDTTPEGGSLTVVKSWGTDTPVTTSFTIDQGLGGFDVDGTDADEAFIDLDAGTYVITETDLEGWTLDSVVCTAVGASTYTANTASGTATIQLAADDDVICTFSNSLDDTTPTGGSLTIAKLWIGGTAGSANFTTSETLNDPDDSFVLDGTTTSQAFPNLANGLMYIVTEATPAGWAITDITCTGATTSVIDDTSAADAVSVTLAADDNVTCTFTNTSTAGLAPDFAVDSSVPDATNNNVPSANLPSSNVPSSNIPSANIPPADSNAVSNAPAPSSNVPSAQLPSTVSNESPVSNVAGEQAPLPPSAGNSQSSGTTSIALLAGLAILAGALGAVGYGLRRR